MNDVTIKLHAIADDGLPDMDALIGRVAFIFDGCIVSGWPLDPEEDSKDEGVLWEANTDVGHNQPMYGVTHWVEFPSPVWELVRPVVAPIGEGER